VTLVYPAGDYTAFLTAVLETWKHRAPEWTIAADAGDWFGPEGPRRTVVGDPEAARRIAEGVEAHAGALARRTLGEAFLHADPGREGVLTEFIRACVRHRGATLDRRADPEVRETLRRARAVRAEAHRYLGLLRFESVAGQGWYARFEPDHDVLTLLSGAFGDRFGGEDWMLHDLGRKTAWVVRGGEGELVRGVRVEADRFLGASEAQVQDLWRRYFSHIAIEGRKNPVIQRSKMPVKTWKHLVERPQNG